MAHRGLDGAYGDLKERRQKLDAKYDAEVEKIQTEFIEKNANEKKTGTFHEWLKDGTVLCKLINKLQPGAVKKVHNTNLAFKQMENISAFLSALPSFGVRPEDTFQTADLFEGVNMAAVQTCLESVRRIADMKAKGIKVEAVAPTRAQVNTGSTKPAGVAPAPAKAPAASSGGAKYAAAKSDNAAYGDLAERMAKMEAKYNPELEKEIRGWIEGKTGEKLGDDFHGALRDGTVLCKLANAIQPNAVKKVNSSALAFKQMENINNFLEFARNKGVKPNDLFQTVDLYEAANMTQVLQTLDNLKRLC